MVGRIVEIAEDGRYLSKSRGFLIVEVSGDEAGRVPLDDIAAVIANAHGITWSNNLLNALAERGIPAIMCGPNHRPSAILWAVDGHHEQAGRMIDQAGSSLPTKKRLWAQIVRAKIDSQRVTLETSGAPHEGFALLSRKVRSGDPDNVEAQAARRYWPLLFGEKFRRTREAPGINAMLNYAYTVLRAGTARAIMATGLHPSFGLSHRQRGNAFALADDLMEPYRPVADLIVKDLVDDGKQEVDRDVKVALARLLVTDMSTSEGISPMAVSMERLALSLARCFSGKATVLELPRRTLPLEG